MTEERKLEIMFWLTQLAEAASSAKQLAIIKHIMDELEKGGENDERTKVSVE